MVGIIILNYNSAEDTKKCIASIKKYTSISYKIFVVDGASNDDSYSYLKEYFKANKSVKLIKSEINGGYSYGNNLGIKEAIKDNVKTLLIINPDVVLLNNAIDLMYDSIQQNSDVAVVGPRIFGPNNEDMQFAAKLLSFSSFIWNRKPFIFLLNKYIKENRFYKLDINSSLKFQGMVSGCCFMIKTTDFIKINFFDENVFLYYEEDIISYKLVDIEKLSMINVDAHIFHNHSSSVKKEGSAFTRYHRFISSSYVLKKYGKLNNFQLCLVSIFVIIPFLCKALFNTSYRKLLKQLIVITLNINEK